MAPPHRHLSQARPLLHWKVQGSREAPRAEVPFPCSLNPAVLGRGAEAGALTVQPEANQFLMYSLGRLLFVLAVLGHSIFTGALCGLIPICCPQEKLNTVQNCTSTSLKS